MVLNRLGLAAVALLGFGLAGCADGYGYSGVSVGYGSAGYYDPYYGDGYGAAGYYGDGLDSPYYGWYNDFYYPGTGIYVYDRYQRPFRWNDDQRRYWEGRRGNWRGGQVRDNWNDFRRDVRNERRDYRGDLRDNRQAYRAGTIDRSQFRQGRQDARREFRSDVRRDYREFRRDTPGFRGNANPGARAGGATPGARAGGGRFGGGRRGRD